MVHGAWCMVSSNSNCKVRNKVKVDLTSIIVALVLDLTSIIVALVLDLTSIILPNTRQ